MDFCNLWAIYSQNLAVKFYGIGPWLQNPEFGNFVNNYLLLTFYGEVNTKKKWV